MRFAGELVMNMIKSHQYFFNQVGFAKQPPTSPYGCCLWQGLFQLLRQKLKQVTCLLMIKPKGGCQYINFQSRIQIISHAELSWLMVTIKALD